jgi:SAM-dependent methyltransferase
MALEITTAYARRAVEYAEQLGSMTSVHPADLQLVTRWADRLEGPVIDAGGGPGHWTGYLADRGVKIRGVDLVPSFIDHARREHPHVSFAVGDIGTLPEAAGSIAGILAWYSLIHHELAPSGTLSLSSPVCCGRAENCCSVSSRARRSSSSTTPSRPPTAGPSTL